MSQKELNHAWTNAFFQHIFRVLVVYPLRSTISYTTEAKSCASQKTVHVIWRMKHSKGSSVGKKQQSVDARMNS